MKALLACVLLLILFSSCKKTNESGKKPDPGPFYIRYKINDSLENHTTASDYIFQGRGISSGAAGSEFFPETWMSPLKPVYSNVNMYYSMGFSFSYTPPCPTCRPVDWVSCGNALFTIGERQFCYTGINYLAEPIDLTCSNNNGITLYFNSTGGILFNSGSGIQPVSSFYSIDTVTDFHSRDTTLYYGNYDKIISGRFTCRMFNPENLAEYQDLTQGEFRMPIWLNDPY